MRGSKGEWLPVLLAFALMSVLVAPLCAQTPGNYNEIEAKRQANVQDTEGIWVLDFRFTAPRLITVDIPGRGRKVCWYMMYRVTNNTKEPRTLIPDFELVTLDPPQVYHDQVLPKVQDAVRQIEDPTGHLEIKNSVTISAHPLLATKLNAVPKPMTGVAIWEGVNPEITRFSIFVSGLSNGWSVDDKNVVRRKTLQLNFRRTGDRFLQDSREIRFVPPAEWLYRASTVKSPDAAKPEGKKPTSSEKKP